MLNPLKQVANSFIFTFGITPPTPEKERTATIFISTLLVATVFLVLGLGALVLRLLITQ